MFEYETTAQSYHPTAGACSLGRVDDLMNLAKGDIEHVLTEELFGIRLSHMQALALANL